MFNRRPPMQQQLIDRINMCQKFETMEPGTLQVANLMTRNSEAHKEVYVRLKDVIDVIDTFHGIVKLPQGGIVPSPSLEWTEE